MLVEDLMAKDVSCCKPENNLAEVAEVMWKQRCGALPVIDGAAKVVGIITDRDICIALGTRNVRASDTLVSDVVSRECITCHARDDLRKALETMASQQVGRLPVVDNEGRLAGLISMDEIAVRTGGGCSDLTDREIIDAMKALWENRVQQVYDAADDERALNAVLTRVMTGIPDEAYP